MSTRITTGMVQRNNLADLNRVNDRLVRTQQKVASNREITKPSDDPFSAARALALRTSLDGTRQYAKTPVPYAAAADAYAGSTALVERQIGPGVELPLGVLGSDFLGGGPAAADEKVLHVLRDVATHLRANDTAALRDDLLRLDTNLEQLLGVRSLNGARQNRLDAALSRLESVEEATLEQLSNTEDADIAKTLIDLDSQQAAYQAALRAGANIVQSSLMDFLR